MSKPYLRRLSMGKTTMTDCKNRIYEKRCDHHEAVCNQCVQLLDESNSIIENQELTTDEVKDILEGIINDK